MGNSTENLNLGRWFPAPPPPVCACVRSATSQTIIVKEQNLIKQKMSNFIIYIVEFIDFNWY